MSRTYRRKKNGGLKYHWAYDVYWELARFEGKLYYLPADKNSKEYKKRLAKVHSDAGTLRYLEPGPSWFRNLETERPQRRDGKRELQKFMNDPDYEPMFLPKDPLDYWS